MPIQILLPWIDYKTAANSGMSNRGMRARRKKKKEETLLLTRSTPQLVEKQIPIQIIFHPPDRRARDLDNALACLKGELDAIAHRIGVDDKYFRPITIDWGAVIKNGQVIITLDGEQKDEKRERSTARPDLGADQSVPG